MALIWAGVLTIVASATGQVEVQQDYGGWSLTVAPASSWAATEAFCQSQGGSLASVHSAEEDEVIASFMRQHTSTTYPWLGGRSLPGYAPGGEDALENYAWSDGTVWNYTNARWVQNDQHPNALHFYRSGAWGTLPIAQTRWGPQEGICMIPRPAGRSAAPTIAPTISTISTTTVTTVTTATTHTQLGDVARAIAALERRQDDADTAAATLRADLSTTRSTLAVTQTELNTTRSTLSTLKAGVSRTIAGIPPSRVSPDDLFCTGSGCKPVVAASGADVIIQAPSGAVRLQSAECGGVDICELRQQIQAITGALRDL